MAFKEECGVFGIYGHSEAANLTYLGLYALQHRGQESVGIATSDGGAAADPQGHGLRRRQLRRSRRSAGLAGMSAVGHVRYSTAGESGLKNAQPILIDCAHGEIAICHNGNLVNAQELRDDARRARDRSSRPRATPRCCCISTRGRRRATPEQALVESVVAGAGRVLARAADEGSADCRARSARIPAADARQARRRLHRLLGDLRARSDRRRVDSRHRAGRGVHRRPGGRRSRSIRSRRRRRRTASSSTSTSRGPTRTCSARASTKCGRSSAARLAREQPALGRRRRAGSRLRRVRGDRIRRGVGPAAADGPDPQSLRRPHVHRAAPVDPALRRAREAESGQEHPAGPARRARRRFDRARHDEPEDRQDGARGRRERSAHADQLSADDFAVLLRRRHAEARRADRRDALARGDPAVHRRRLARVSQPRRHARRRSGPARQSYCTSCYTGQYPVAFPRTKPRICSSR